MQRMICIISIQDVLAWNVCLVDNLLCLGQEFIGQILIPKGSDDDGCNSCPPPLLLYFDDYLGNEQNEILTTILSSQTILFFLIIMALAPYPMLMLYVI